MINNLIYRQCIEQVELLERKLRLHCDVSVDCLGGDMNPMYEKVRLHQLRLAKKIKNDLKN